MPAENAQCVPLFCNELQMDCVTMVVEVSSINDEMMFKSLYWVQRAYRAKALPLGRYFAWPLANRRIRSNTGQHTGRYVTKGWLWLSERRILVDDRQGEPLFLLGPFRGRSYMRPRWSIGQLLRL